MIERRVSGPLRVQTSFQDTPDGIHFSVLRCNDRPLEEQLDELGLKDGDVVILWEPDCGDFTMEAMLLVNYQHPMSRKRELWAKKISD